MSDNLIYHYTTAEGLLGIIESGCLWATHCRYLNDAEEISDFRKSILDPKYEEAIGERKTAYGKLGHTLAKILNIQHKSVSLKCISYHFVRNLIY